MLPFIKSIIAITFIAWVLIFTLAIGASMEKDIQAPYIQALIAQASKTHCPGEITFPTMTGE